MKSSDVRLAVRVLRKIMRDKSASHRDRLSASVEVLNRVVGTPTAADLAERVEQIEKLLDEQDRRP